MVNLQVDTFQISANQEGDITMNSPKPNKSASSIKASINKKSSVVLGSDFSRRFSNRNQSAVASASLNKRNKTYSNLVVNSDLPDKKDVDF